MTAQAENKSSALSYVLLILAVVVIGVGLWGYYYFVKTSVLYSALFVVGAIAIALGLVYLTPVGKAVISYVKAARGEVRKVVWPTRQESMQTLLLVAVFTGVLSLFLLLCDLIAGKGFQWLMP